jgi:hypothetical protein
VLITKRGGGEVVRRQEHITGYRQELKGAHTGQIWDGLSTKIQNSDKRRREETCLLLNASQCGKNQRLGKKIIIFAMYF